MSSSQTAGPLEWNQWPEITWRDPLSPGHLGDVPHTWIAAEYMLALISMVASEREATGETCAGIRTCRGPGFPKERDSPCAG